MGIGTALNAADLQISRGETVADTARVLSRYLHGMVIRCHEHALLEEFARVSGDAAEPTSKSFFDKAKKFF